MIQYNCNSIFVFYVYNKIRKEMKMRKPCITRTIYETLFECTVLDESTGDTHKDEEVLYGTTMAEVSGATALRRLKKTNPCVVFAREIRSESHLYVMSIETFITNAEREEK